MNDATTPWIDPELIAANRLLQEKGLVAPNAQETAAPEGSPGRWPPRTLV